MAVVTVIVGDEKSLERWALMNRAAEDVSFVSNLRELEAVRMSLRTSGVRPMVVLLPGWSRTGLMNEATLYALGVLDGMAGA
jgi:hypothetical protein